MKTQNNVILLEDVEGFLLTPFGVSYTDISGARLHIPMKVLVRLYEGAKYDAERKGVNWKEFCNSLFMEGAA